MPLATPEWQDMGAVLSHLKKSRCIAIVVAPSWKGAPWWPLLEEICVWRYFPPRDVPMFVAVGVGMEGVRVNKLKWASAFCLVDGSISKPRHLPLGPGPE